MPDFSIELLNGGEIESGLVSRRDTGSYRVHREAESLIQTMKRTRTVGRDSVRTGASRPTFENASTHANDPLW